MKIPDYGIIWHGFTGKLGVAESRDDFAQFETNFQGFQPPIHPAFMQRRKLYAIPSRNKCSDAQSNYYFII
jgi:hypothetical protein